MQALRTNMSTRFHSAILGLVCVTLLATAPAQATTTYGDFMGDNFTYIDVKETAVSNGDTEPLFGPPTVIGDQLRFLPTVFKSESPVGTDQSDITDGRLDFMIEAKPGKRITDVQFFEGGAWAIVGGGAGNSAFASLAGFLFIDEIDNAAAFLPPIPFGGQTPIFMGPGGNTWVLGDDIDLNAILANNGITPSLGVTKVTVALNDTLATSANLGSTSFIDKKFFGVNVVPEPSTGAMGMLGLVMGLSMMRRRNNQS